MLVISRKRGESIKVADDIEIFVISVDGQRVRVGIKAPRNIRVLRSELEPVVAESNQTAVVKCDELTSDLLKKAAEAQRTQQD